MSPLTQKEITFLGSKTMINKQLISIAALLILLGSVSPALCAASPPPTPTSATAETAPATGETAPAATPVLYDGLWFLGFNLNKDIFSDRHGVQVKKAIGQALDRETIAKTIMGSPVVPDSIVPKTMDGYLAKSYAPAYSAKAAKAILRSAGYSAADKRLDGLSLLHTDGVKTIQIAKLIKKNLAAIGIKIDLVQVAYRDEEKWQTALQSGKFHMFLLGYKASSFGALFIGDTKTLVFHKIGCAQLPGPDYQVFFSSFAEGQARGYAPCKICQPAKEAPVNAYDLLNPLFYSKGSANFCFYQNEKIDNLLDQLAIMDVSLGTERNEKFLKINSILCEELPVIPLFYIEKL